MDISSISPSPSPVDKNDEEKEAFHKLLERKKLLQLEALEMKLAAFAGFNRNNPIKYQYLTRKKPSKKSNVTNSEDFRDEINNNTQVKEFCETPSFIKGTMFDYQIDGLNWMISLHRNGLNGILADEMGLGKTIQSISMLGYLMNKCQMKGPFLVIAPLTTLENWIREITTFLPSAKALRAHALGDEKIEVLQKLKNPKRSWHVTVTSYQFFTNHKYHFQKVNFYYAIIDEGHIAKNENTRFPKALKLCNIQSMIMLTGTPVHNNLHELWALLNLLMPLFFNNALSFDSWFKVEDCVDPTHEQTIRLHNLLKPLMLRRTKDVVTAIPSKVRVNIYVPPTEQMCIWSHKLANNNIMKVNPDGSLSQLYIGNVFMQFRKMVQHPFLIPGGEPETSNFVTNDIVEHSAKMIVLDKLLSRLHKRGSKVLIFSQFVLVLDVLMDYLDWRGYKYCTLHGKTTYEERGTYMEEFNRPDSDKFIFLLSTRAGGLGINLVAADTVIFYDMDFNPQLDYQAEDRAHRIGQRKKVHVFRLLVRGSIDELLFKYAERKRLLDESVIKRSTLSKHAIQEAFEFQLTSLTSNGLIDKVAVDRELDELFEQMNTQIDPVTKLRGLQEDCSIILPGIAWKLRFDVETEEKNSRKRANNSVSPILGKRRRFNP